MALIDKLTNIANAIRSKTGGTASLTLDEMVTAIEGIEGGGGLENGYDVTFLDEYNEELALFSVKQGHAINSPVYNCKFWQTEDGTNITFPYIPTEDIVIYANNNTYASEIYRYYGVNSGVYPYIAVSHSIALTGGGTLRLWFGKRLSINSDGKAWFYESLTANKYAGKTTIPVENIVTALQTYIDPTSLTAEDSSLIYSGSSYNNYSNFDAPFNYSENVYRLDT